MNGDLASQLIASNTKHEEDKVHFEEVLLNTLSTGVLL
jgi:hypothetical protein